MRRNPALLILGLVISTVVSTGGCIWSDGEGLDLAVRGRLALYIDRESGSAKADVFGSVNDIKAFLFPVVVLEDDQVISVNDVPIANPFGFYGGEIGAVNAPAGYTVTFNNKGTIKTLVVAAPVDFGAVSPAADSEVSRKGFDVTWSPSGDAEVRVEVKIRGLEEDDDYYGEPDETSETISNLPDNGSVRIGEPDLAKFLNGEIELTVTRHRRFTGDLGFAESSIRVSSSAMRSLTLTD